MDLIIPCERLSVKRSAVAMNKADPLNGKQSKQVSEPARSLKAHADEASSYSDYLESKLKPSKVVKSTVASQGSKDPSPISASQPSACGNCTSAESHNKTQLTRTVSSASSSQLDLDVDHRTSGDSDVRLGSFEAVDSASSVSNDDMDNALLQVTLVDFKEHLAGISDKGTYIRAPSAVPPLELQKHFLASAETKDNSIKDTIPTEQAALVSPALASCGYRMPSQFALLGEISQAGKWNDLSDPRIILNMNVPFSAFICGVQGSGKSHTTSCMIASLGSLTRSISTLVLQFNEYSSSVSSQPSEAAFLASVMPEHAQQQQIPLRVLASPTNLYNLEKMYSQIPNVQV
ncbi:hypothetical protein IFM47457_11204 [Aspergillus lentulus]|nr:hypothetical protein IFM47457_11204 [Aspergillus lentulus]